LSAAVIAFICPLGESNFLADLDPASRRVAAEWLPQSEREDCACTSTGWRVWLLTTWLVVAAIWSIGQVVVALF
jgi:hypothetical protein